MNLNYYDPREVSPENFSYQQLQQIQQYKLLEFQQKSKRQQVEKVLPLEDFADLDSEQHSSYIGQRLVEFKQNQQNQLYEHQLQQQYENRDIIEDALRGKHNNPFMELYEDGNDEENEKNDFYSNDQPKQFSPDITDSDLDSEFSLTNCANVGERVHHSNCMPVLEDGLSSGHVSDAENNNSDPISCRNFEDITTIPPAQTLEIYASKAGKTQKAPFGGDQQNISSNYASPTSEEFHFTNEKSQELESTLINIQSTLDRSKRLSSSINEALVHTSASKNNNQLSKSKENVSSPNTSSTTADDEADTDLETDRLLGLQKQDELLHGNFDDNKVRLGSFFKNFMLLLLK